MPEAHGELDILSNYDLIELSLFLPRGGNFRLTKQTNKQTTMKNKILALLASVGLVASASAVEINENLSINGFIDGSFKSVESDAAGAGGQENWT